jgi:uncharacterized protein YndB with AHSA1/START domain
VGRTPGPEPEIELGEAGTVVVAAATTTRPDDAWAALTERARVAHWFGELSDELTAGAHVRLGFGDGDFFDLEVERVEWPVVRWTWRFMGTGPQDKVELRVDAHGDVSRVTVTDREPDRGADEARALGEGWRDFTSRLQRYLATGERSRYDWRSDVDVSIALPIGPDAARRLLLGAAAGWLPLPPGAESLIAADVVVLDDGEAPARFAIGDLAGTGPASVRFELRPEGLDGALETRIAVTAHGDGSTLAIAQSGFRKLSVDIEGQRRIRERFASAWRSAVLRAADLVTA